MGFREPYKITTITIQRWQQRWLDEHTSVKLSPLISAILGEMIRQSDPEYYAEVCKNKLIVEQPDFIKYWLGTHNLKVVPLFNK